MTNMNLEEVNLNLLQLMIEIKNLKKSIKSLKRLLDKGTPIIGFTTDPISNQEIGTTIYTQKRTA